MKVILFVILGGAAGTLARYALSGVVQPAPGQLPLGTLLVNVLGSFLLGFLMRYLTGSLSVTPDMRAALTIGFCGAFTTMSTFAYETVMLLERGALLRAAGYFLGTVGGSLAAVLAGLGLAGRLL